MQVRTTFTIILPVGSPVTATATLELKENTKEAAYKYLWGRDILTMSDGMQVKVDKIIAFRVDSMEEVK